MSDAFDDDAGDRSKLYVISRAELPTLLHAALAGNIRAMEVLREVLSFIANAEQAPRRSPMVCDSCRRPIKHRRAYCIGIFVSDPDQPCGDRGVILCRHCCGTNAAAWEAAFRAIDNLCSDAESIVISHPEGGHA